MKFTVPDLKSLSKAVRECNTRERTALSVKLHRRQPDFCEIIDEVGIDPRCAEAHQFCTIFCALAFRHAERIVGYRLPRFPAYAIKEAAGFMARGEEAYIGKRACKFPKRIHRHVLIYGDFDDDDTAWLCTMISAFLFSVERSL
jgi:hypothetical protein